MTKKNRIIVTLILLGCILAGGVFVWTTLRSEDVVHRVDAPLAQTQNHAEDSALNVRAAIDRVKAPDEREDLGKLYAATSYHPLWSADRPGRRRLAAIDALAAQLEAQGVKYSFLTSARARLTAATSREDVAEADVGLSLALLHAARGQRFGFISAQTLDWNLAPDSVDVAAELGKAVASGELSRAVEQLKPPQADFTALVAALQRYRTIAASGGWPTINEEKEIDLAGDPQLPALRARLYAEGFLMDRDSDSDLTEAVKEFQARNGLEPDGRVGRGTLTALNVPVEERIGQITANLERWRHVRHEDVADGVLANVADQTVVVRRGGREHLRLRTVVGSKRHATPILEARMTAVTLNPPWEIPTSIIANEILPKLDAEPSYLINNGMDVVGGTWDKPRSLRIRQRPGAGNSLGRVKFQMQNQWNIYLHDTPSRNLFTKTERYFSHGCVRVENPELLAATLTGLSVEEISDGIAAGETHTVKLAEPLPVFVMYWTAFSDEDGHLQLRRDVYGRDASTVAALRAAGLAAPIPGVADTGS